MALAPGIVQTARSLGISPVDLATVISYETAGTFDPTKRGPTTQWGQHRGLIQFGEPQAQQYGVNWDDPIGSQLGENGAIAKYLRQAGVQPGMGLLDVYSAVNAGRVGRYNASDANNGGAPGTVRDKVEKQMADHRRKAMSLLGGDYTPPPVDQMRQVGGSPMQQQQGLLGMIGAPDTKRKTYKGLGEAIKASAADGSIWDTVAMGLNSMRGQFADPNITAMAQGRSESREQERVANATAEWLRQNGREDLAGAIEGGMISGAQAFEMMQGPGPVEGKVVGDNLVNPYTGELIGNYAQEQQPYQVITGETAQAYGLDPAKAYNVSPDGRVTEIGGNGVVVNNNMGGDKFDEAFATQDATALGAISEAGIAAQRNMARIDQMEELLQDSPSGFGALAAQRAGEWGINTEGLDSLQAAQALINAMVPEQRQPGSGPMSDADLELFKQSLPRIINQPEGNRLIIQTLRGIAQYDAEGARIAQAVRDGTMTRAQGFEALQNRPNPLDGFKAPAGGMEAPVAAPTAEASGGVPDGIDPGTWEYMTPEEKALFQ